MSCPICGKKSIEKYTPFCSKQCSYVDLNRWLVGGYSIPGSPFESDEEATINGKSKFGN